jgi:FMN phosphatase YigB (HAD superfamily)
MISGASGSSANRCRYTMLILDLDNTLYDWVRYYAGSLRSVIEMLSGAMGVSREDLIDQFREVFARRGSVEYAFIVQELSATQNEDSGVVEELIDLAQRTFAEARRELLRPYDGVRETLEGARAAGIAVIAVTNAPFFQAHRRLKQLGLLEYFDALGAWEGFAVSEKDPYVRHVRERSERGEYSPGVPIHRAFGKDSLKPGDDMFRWALDVFRAEPQKALAVGDSIAKDVAPAMSLGLSGAWCAYGATHDDEDFELLLTVTPWRPAEIAKTYSGGFSASCSRLDRFSDLAEVMGFEQPTPVSPTA